MCFTVPSVELFFFFSFWDPVTLAAFHSVPQTINTAEIYPQTEWRIGVFKINKLGVNIFHEFTSKSAAITVLKVPKTEKTIKFYS